MTKSHTGNVLITLIIFMLVASLVVASAVAIIITNSGAASKSEQGQMAYQAAEGGLEEAILQILRDPNYSGSVSNVAIGLSHYSYTVDTNNPKNIDVYGNYHHFRRHLHTTTSYNQGQLLINSWQDTFN